MKYIKTFEKELNYGKYYWVVFSSDPIYVRKSLEKLKWENETIEDILVDIEYIYSKSNILFFGYENRIGRGEIYDVQEYESEFMNKNYKFMGEIKLTKKEIDDVNMKQNINKFNI